MAAMLVGAISVMAFPAPALAATSGCGNTCDGKDPSTYYATVDDKVMRCSYANVATLDSTTSVELRYSPFCRTAWARPVTPGYLGYVTIESYTAKTGGTLRKRYRAQTGDPWSLMVNDKNLYARACHYSYESEYEAEKGGPGHLDGCTGRF